MTVGVRLPRLHDRPELAAHAAINGNMAAIHSARTSYRLYARLAIVLNLSSFHACTTDRRLCFLRLESEFDHRSLLFYHRKQSQQTGDDILSVRRTLSGAWLTWRTCPLKASGLRSLSVHKHEIGYFLNLTFIKHHI